MEKLRVTKNSNPVLWKNGDGPFVSVHLLIHETGGQIQKDRPHDIPNDIQFKYKRLEIIIRYAFFQTVYRIAKMNSVAFDSGAFHPEMVTIACIRDVNRQ